MWTIQRLDRAVTPHQSGHSIRYNKTRIIIRIPELDTSYVMLTVCPGSLDPMYMLAYHVIGPRLIGQTLDSSFMLINTRSKK